MAAQIEVYPDKSGEWRWRKRAGNNKVTADSGEGYETRAGAFEAALAERDDEAIVLVREDGSTHGELYHAKGGGAVQRVDILAATTSEKAVNNGG